MTLQSHTRDDSHGIPGRYPTGENSVEEVNAREENTTVTSIRHELSNSLSHDDRRFGLKYKTRMSERYDSLVDGLNKTLPRCSASRTRLSSERFVSRRQTRFAAARAPSVGGLARSRPNPRAASATRYYPARSRDVSFGATLFCFSLYRSALVREKERCGYNDEIFSECVLLQLSETRPRIE